MIYSLYGQPGSGKTTLAGCLSDRLRFHPWSGNDAFLLDGDDFRELFKNKNYTREGRYQNIRNVNAVATYLNKTQSKDVILSFVNPYEGLRRELKENNIGQVREIMLFSNRELRKEYYVEDFEQGEPDYFLLTDSEVEETWKHLKKLLEL